MNARSDQAPSDCARSSATAFLLEQDGFCLARDLAALSVHRVAAELDRHFDGTPFCTGDFYGERTKRFGRLLTRSPSMRELVMNPVILAVAQRFLGPHCDVIQLNVTQAIEIHPGALAQFPHRDQDMWPGADNRHEFLINVIWPLTPFTFGESSGGFRRLIQIVFGLSIAFAASSFFLSFFSFGGGALVA
jgi:hypothetical protein